MSAPVVPLPQVDHQRALFAEGLALDCGMVIAPMAVAYETYGTLNAARTNAVLVCHALTADQYVSATHPLTGRPGWWDTIVGPGLPLDTDRYFLICANVLGGCMGSTGPREEMTDPEGRPMGRPWGTDFPNITIRDMVRAQKLLVDRLGIERLLGVIGGSMGGMQVLEWAATFPDAVYAAAPIATAAYHSAQNIAFNEVGRAAIHSDPDWRGGRYWEDGGIPAKGLSVARMVAHITYLSEQALTRKFGRRLRGASSLTFLEDVFEVESYLRHQGSTFVRRFDANSYLTITRAMDYFDLGRGAWRRPLGRLPRDEDPLLRLLLLLRLALPDQREPRRGPRPERRGGQCQLRRDRLGQGPRRLPAGGAGLPPGARRLPRRLRRPAGRLAGPRSRRRLALPGWSGAGRAPISSPFPSGSPPCRPKPASMTD